MSWKRTRESVRSVVGRGGILNSSSPLRGAVNLTARESQTIRNQMVQIRVDDLWIECVWAVDV